MLRKKVGNETDVPHKIGEVQNCASKEKWFKNLVFSANRSQLVVFRSFSRLVSLLSWLERSSGGKCKEEVLHFPPWRSWTECWGGGASGSR